MSSSVLDRVNISKKAYDDYQKFVWRCVGQLVLAELSPDEIPNEEAEELPDGSLLIFIDLPKNKGRVEFTIPPKHWCWRDAN